jgi:glycosyltransferase involved in cell wall biosynthesis
VSSVLFVCRRPPWPLTNGGRIRSHRLVEGLARRFDVVLLTMDHRPGSPDDRVDLAGLSAALPDVEIRTVRGLGSRKRADQFRSLLRKSSWGYGRYVTEAFRAEIARVVRERGIDVIHADDLGAALALPDRAELAGAPIIAYVAHNIESQIIDGDARAAGNALHRAFAAVDGRKLRAEERSVWNSVDLNFAVSDHDARLMRAETDRRVAICPNGTDPVSAIPLRTRPADDPLRLVFVGSAAYAPYERGLAWFGRTVLPELRKHHRITFDVVGQRPRQAPTAPEIVCRGYVDDVATWYARADAVVVPVFEGSGTRLKLVEAAAFGRPIVTTELGAQGLPLEPEKHFLRAETAEEFVDQVRRIATATMAIETMVEAARAAVSDLFWPKIAGSLANDYNCALSAATGR